MELTPQQNKAIGEPVVNMQLIACAGSGKTEVVARRVVRLLDLKGPDKLLPANIIAFTFTDKAAGELKERIVTRCREQLGDIVGLAELYVGTIHGFCLDLLKTEVPEYLKYEVLNEVQQGLFIDRNSAKSGLTASTDLNGNPLRRYRDTQHYIAALSHLREAGTIEDQLADCTVLDGLDMYRDLLEGRRYFDYSAILELAVGELTNNRDLRGRLSDRLRYLIVDEYQDVNPIQEAIVWLLHDMGAKVCVVGDDDQTIYQWRGSEVDKILTFKDRYPKVRQTALEHNFRSSEGIVETARPFIEQNTARLEKVMQPTTAQPYDVGDIARNLGKQSIVLTVRNLVLDRWELFEQILFESPFFEQLTVPKGENRELACGRLADQLKKAHVKLKELHKRDSFDKAWEILSDERNQKIFYRTQSSRERFNATLEESDPDDFFSDYWEPVATLFREDREGAKSINSALSDLLRTNVDNRPILVVDLSREQAHGLFWNDKIQSLVIKRLLDGLSQSAEHFYKEGESLNTLVVIDEAHRLAPRDLPREDDAARGVRSVLIDAARTTRKYGLGWLFISQTLSSLHSEILQQLRIFFFGFGLGLGQEFQSLRQLVGSSGTALDLYQLFRDPHSAFDIASRQYSFMTIGPVSPLSFSGSPLFLNAYNTVEAFLETNGLSSGDTDYDSGGTSPNPPGGSEPESDTGAEPEDEAQGLIDRILKWAESHENFDPSFVKSMQTQFEDKGFLTDGQLKALQNIITKWHVE